METCLSSLLSLKFRNYCPEKSKNKKNILADNFQNDLLILL